MQLGPCLQHDRLWLVGGAGLGEKTLSRFLQAQPQKAGTPEAVGGVTEQGLLKIRPDAKRTLRTKGAWVDQQLRIQLFVEWRTPCQQRPQHQRDGIHV